MKFASHFLYYLQYGRPGEQQLYLVSRLRSASRVNRFLLATLVALAACSPAPPPPEVNEKPAVQCVNDWTAVARGVEYRMLNCDPSRGFALHLVRVDPRVASIDAVVRPGRTAQSVAQTEHASFALNANFFDDKFRPLGVVVSAGKLVNPPHPVSWQSVFAVTRDGQASIVPVADFSAENIAAAAQAGPRLVIDGKANDVLKARPDLRSGVCIEPDGRAIFFATPLESQFDVHEMVSLASRDLACRDAMLFDGGPSTQMFLAGRVTVEGDKRVPAYVIVR